LIFWRAERSRGRRQSGDGTSGKLARADDRRSTATTAVQLFSLEDLFREPPRILNAMSNGVRFAPALVGRDYLGLDEDDQQRFAANCSNWLTMVQFFKEMFIHA
jgi:hypothetical protein